MKEVKIGLVGTNWMGSFHSVGMNNVRQAYHDVKPVFEHVADVNEAAAKQIRAETDDKINRPVRFGFYASFENTFKICFFISASAPMYALHDSHSRHPASA